MSLVITPEQTPVFRALVETESGTRFTQSDIATQAELTAEGISDVPISFTLYKFVNGVYVKRTPFISVQIDVSAYLTDTTLDYNFEYIPNGRSEFLFPDSGEYVVEFKTYPKTGSPRITWRTPVTVVDSEE